MGSIGYWMIKGFAFLISLTPFPLLYLKSDCYAFLLCHVIRYRRKVVRDNLMKSFPEKSLKEIKKIEWRFYRDFCDVFLETCKLLSVKDAKLKQRIVVENPGVLDSLYEKGKSVFLAMQHSGNWEWYNYLMPDMLRHRPHAIYKRFNNASFDQLVREIRSHHSSNADRMIDSHDAKGFFGNMDRECRAVIILGDQSPRGVDSDYWTDFLHRYTCWYPGLEILARNCDFAVVYVENRRKGRGHYTITYHTICEDPATVNDGFILEQYVRHVERFIKDDPDNWLWSHRRWKHSRQKQAS